MWLLHKQTPCFKTIASFRSNNRTGFRNLFECFRDFCKGKSLYGLKRIAIDGSKFRGQNSKKNNYTPKKIARHLKYIDSELESYLDEMDQLDGLRSQTKLKPSPDRTKVLLERRKKYEELSTQLEASGQSQISTTDPDSRSLTLRAGLAEVGYNIQSAVDDKHNLIADYEVTNKTDYDQLANLALKTKSGLGITEQMEVLADKGYHTAKEMARCHENNIETLVAPKKVAPLRNRKGFTQDKFIYDKDKDLYKCPAGKELVSDGKWYKRKERKKIKRYQVYKLPTQVCSECPYVQYCLAKKSVHKKGRSINRIEHQDAIEKNRRRIEAFPEIYKRRQEMVEHPFGTFKRQWGFSYFLLKTKEKVEAEAALMFLTYNLKRAMNILGKKELIKALKSRVSNFFLLDAAQRMTYHFCNKTHLTYLSSARKAS